MYVALKPMKVPTPTGVEDRKPGDPVPEAAGWKNLRNYIAQKRIGTQFDYDQMMARGKKANPAPAPVIVVAPAPVEEPEAPAEEPDVKSYSDELMGMTKGGVFRIVKELGIDLPRRTDKEDMISAIIEAKGE